MPDFIIRGSQPIDRAAIARVVRASHERRQIRSVFNSLTCLAVFKHDESETQLYVSHNDDPLEAVWIKKNPLLLDPRFTGRFLVITLTQQLAREKNLVSPILNLEKYLPEEREEIREAIDAAYRARQRHRGGTSRMSRNGFSEGVLRFIHEVERDGSRTD